MAVCCRMPVGVVWAGLKGWNAIFGLCGGSIAGE